MGAALQQGDEGILPSENLPSVERKSFLCHLHDLFNFNFNKLTWTNTIITEEVWWKDSTPFYCRSTGKDAMVRKKMLLRFSSSQAKYSNRWQFIECGRMCWNYVCEHEIECSRKVSLEDVCCVEKICQDIREHVYMELANHDKRGREFMHVQVEKW